MMSNKETEYLIFGYIRQRVEGYIPLPIIQLCQNFYSIYEWIDFSMYDPEKYERIVIERESKIVYYVYFNSIYDFRNGVNTLRKDTKSSHWKENDELIMTLDFQKSIFQIVRKRKNTEDAVYSVSIDNEKTYYPGFGIHAVSFVKF